MKIKLFTSLCILGFVVQGWGQVFKERDTISFLNDVEIKGKNSTDDFYIVDLKDDKLITITPYKLPKNYMYIISEIDGQEITLQPINTKLFNTKRIIRRDKRKKFLANKIMDKSIYGVLYNDKKFMVDSVSFYNSVIQKVNKNSDRVSFGLLTLPFKFRFLDDKSFETNFNLNTTLNIRITQLWNAGFYGQVGAGIGNTNLYNSNAVGVSTGEEINAATLTLLSGVMLQYKKVQAGIYLGWDHINNQKNYQWQYNGKPWFGFGVGYQLFKIDLGGSKDANNQ